MTANPPLAEPVPGGIVVCGLAQAKRHKRRFDAVVTLEDPDVRRNDRLRFSGSDGPPHLVLAFEDCDDPSLGYRVATEEQMAEALGFTRGNAAGSLLIHCLHGVGRSAAVALAAFADRLGPGREADAVAALLAGRPQATPNLIAVGLADGLLERDGALIAALAASEATRPEALAMRRRRAEFAAANPGLYAKV